MSPGTLDISRALAFAARAHANQRRKGAAQEPYINHLIEVMDLVARATDAVDPELMIAALMHDVIEDTQTTAEELTEAFGARVTGIVLECSDDMSLPKPERKAARIAHMPHKSAGARIVKTADVISNVRAMVISAPAGWTADWKLGYLDGCRQLIDAGKGVNPWLETLFDDTHDEACRAIREGTSMQVEGTPEAVHELQTTIGQPVHKVYMPNTGNRPLNGQDTAKMGALLAQRFPSGTIESAHGIYDGAMRDVLIARIRCDSTGSIVAFAQALCLEFEQKFAGIEVGGRYIRIYADDTG